MSAPEVTSNVDVRCEHVWEAWGPHEGCREFMTEPEAIVQCDEPATVVITGLEFGFEPPHEPVERRTFSCTHHAADIAKDSMFWTVLSVEAVA